MELEQQPDLRVVLRQYLDIVQRRWKCFIPFPFLAAIAIYYALSLPPIYSSEGVILVEDQNIPEDLIRTTVTSYAAQQMEILRQRVSSSRNVLRMIDEHGLYSSSEETDAESSPDPDRLVELFRTNMGMEAIEADIQDQAGRRRTVSIAFRVWFQDESPQRARDVANELVQLFLDGNLEDRVDDAAKTSVFLTTEADAIQVKLVELNDRLAVFKSEYADSLPELLEHNLQSIDDAEERRRENSIAIDNLIEQEQLLSIELRSVDPYTGGAVGSGSAVSPAALLAQKRAQLAQDIGRYSDSHPDMQSLRREISRLEADLASGVSSGGSSNLVLDEDLLSPVYLDLRYRVGSIERDIGNLREDNRRLDRLVADYNQRVANTYIVEREYEELQREVLANEERYEQLRGAQYEAEVAQNLEINEQAESLQVLERPGVPAIPVGPERPKIMLLGLGLVGAFCFGLAMIYEFLDERVRGLRSFESLIGQPPLIAVRQIRTPSEALRKRRLKKALVVGGVLLLVILVGLLFWLASPTAAA